MSGEQLVKVPMLSDINRRFNCRDTEFLRHMWRGFNKRFDKADYEEDRDKYIYIWYNLMVLTDILKTRSAWDFKKEKPMKGPVT